ncbi:hypothetical protein IWX63_003302 [Arthrobacter sp. CAN_A2]
MTVIDHVPALVHQEEVLATYGHRTTVLGTVGPASSLLRYLVFDRLRP